MTKEFLEEQKKKLEEKKEKLEKELRSFAKKDSRVKGNWKTQFPDFGIKTADLSEETDRIEEYEATLPVEYALEIELQKTNEALKKIKKRNYGICQNCKKKIKIERLKVYPETELCFECANKKT